MLVIWKKFIGSVKESVVVAPVILPEESICPNSIVKPLALFKLLTLSNVGMFWNCCKFGVSSESSPPGPAAITSGGPLNLTIEPAALWWSSEKTFT